MGATGVQPAWDEVSGEEYAELWDRFNDRFSFTPRAWVAPSAGPAAEPPARTPVFSKPDGTVTFDLATANQQAWSTWTVHAVNALVVQALAQVVDDPAEAVLVLDWQHPAYQFWPQRSVLYGGANPFPFQVFPWPDGDYYAFLTRDMREGTFGHPWEQTLCVFGTQLVPLLVPSLDRLLPRSTPTDL